MKIRASGMWMIAVLAVVVAAGACQAGVTAVTIDLSLTVNEGAKTWEAYATLTDPSNETLGLHGIYIDVWGSQSEYGAWTGGLAVNSFTNDLPQGLYFKAPATFVSLGFYANATGTAVDTGYTLVGSMQSNTHTVIVDVLTYDNIFTTVGESAGSANSVIPASVSWAYPVLVAHGTYTGDVGWLNVAVRSFPGEPDPTSATVLPATLPASGNTFATFSPLAGDDYRGSVLIPEPATLALLGLGGLGVLLRRKRR